MHSLLSSGYGPWIELLLPLGLGPLVVAAVAALVCRRLRSAVWQRTAWQAGAIALVILLLAELSGAGPALVGLCKTMPATTGNLRPSGNSDADTPGVGGVCNADLPEERDESPLQAAPAVSNSRTASAKLSGPPVGTRTATTIDAGHTAFSPTPWQPPALQRIEPARSQAPEGRPIAARLSVAPGLTGPTGDAGLGTGTAALSPRENRDRRRVVSGTPLGWIAAFWLFGTMVLAARIARCGRLLASGRRSLEAVSDEILLGRVERLARRLGMRRPVRVLQAVGLSAPAVCGVLRPTLVLPAGFDRQFAACEQEAMLAHELAHLASRDPAWKLLVDLLAAALWWQPAVWWMRRKLWASSEAAADEASLLVPGGPDVLAACLVTIGRRLTSHRRLGWISITGSGFRSGLGRRVQRLLSLPERAWHAPRRGRLLAARTALPLLLATVAVFSTAWARPQANSSEGESTMNVLSSSWRRSLAALSLAALLGPISGDAAADDSTPAPATTTVTGERTAPAADQLALLDGEEEEGDREGDERAEHRDRPREGDRERGERAEHRDGPRDGDREERDRPQTDIEHLERRLEELRRAHQQANAAGRREAAEQLEREGHEIMQKLEAIREGRPDRPNRERVERRLEELERAIHEAAEAGRGERVEQLEREAREIHRFLEETARDRRPGPREEIERRMQHVRVAAENLREAGLPDQAERLLHEAERMLSQQREVEGPRPERPGPEIEQLRDEVHQLRREMQELKMHLRELLDDQRREDAEEEE